MGTSSSPCGGLAGEDWSTQSQYFIFYVSWIFDLKLKEISQLFLCIKKVQLKAAADIS